MMIDSRPAIDTPLPSPQPAAALRLWLIVAVAALLLFATTANYGIQWQDGGWQQWRVASGQLEHPLGLALVHPVHYFLCRAAAVVSGLEPAAAVVVVSVVAGAIGVANVAALVWLMSRRFVASAAGALILGLGHTYWQHATHAESYPITLVLLSAEWLCLYQFTAKRQGRWLTAALLLNGIGIGNHNLATLATPVLAVVVITAWRRKTIKLPAVAAGALAWLFGSLPLATLALARLIATGDLAGTIRSVLVGDFGGSVAAIPLSLRAYALPVGYLVYNFANLGLPLAAWGVWHGGRQVKLLRRVLLAQLIIYLAFALRYDVPDQYAFLLPTYAILAVFAGLGMADLLQHWHPRPRWRQALTIATIATVLLNPLIYVATAHVLRSRGILRQMLGNKPYRDGYSAFLVPWGIGDNYARRVNAEAAELAGDHGLILIGDDMMQFAFYYAQRQGHIGPDVRLEVLRVGRDNPARLAEIATAIEQFHTAGRPVVLVPRDRDNPQLDPPRGAWQRRGDLYILGGSE